LSSNLSKNPVRFTNCFDDSSAFELQIQEDVEVEAGVTGAAPKKRTFRKYSYRGVDLDQLLDMSTDELVKLFPARARRR
jgi:hypothetical protein